MDMQVSEQAGFTLVELMVTIAIVAILATIAVPSFSELTASQRVKAAASNLHISILRARSEAIKRNESIELVPVGGDWAKGWVIQNRTDPIVVLERHAQIGNAIISGPASIRYRSSGRLADTSAAGFSISASGTSSQRCVSVSLSGQPVSKKGAC